MATLDETLRALADPNFQMRAADPSQMIQSSEANLAQVQDRVNYLLANDPTFRQAVGVRQDKGAFPAAFDQPYTGKVRTEGGAARVNAFTEQTGVRAIVDDKGKVTLTNLDTSTGLPTPQSQKQVFGFSPLGGNVSNSITSLLDQLRSTQDPDAARGIASSLKTSLASSQAAMESQAMKFAENKVGLPGLEATLAAAEQLDRQAPGWVPGMGDSKNTAAIRQQIYSARNAANVVAKQWLEGNLGFAQLKTSASTADAELRRIDLLATRKAQVQTTAEIRRGEEIAEERRKAAVEYESLSEPQKQMLLRLNPTLAGKVDNQAEVVAFYKRQVRDDKSFKEVIQADPAEIPALAVKGNTHAMNLLIDEEVRGTGRDSAAVRNDINTIRALIQSPDFARRVVDMQLQGVTGNKEEKRKELTAQFTAARMATGKEEKAAFQERNLQAAIQLFKADRGNTFAADVGSWQTDDPALQAAIKTARQTTGSSSIDNVMAAYVGDKTGPEALAAYSQLMSIMDRAAAKTTGSVFGKVDTSRARATIANAANNSGSLTEWFKQQSSRILQSYRESSVNPFLITLDIAKTVAGAPASANIDPATGKPFGQ